MNKQYEEDDEIDLMGLFIAIREKIVLILIAGILGGLISFAYTRFTVTPMYNSTTSMLVISKDTAVTSQSDLQLATSLINDYKVLAVSQPVLKQVIEDLDLPISYQSLGSLITVSNPSSSRILKFTVTYSDPVTAAAIANDLAEVATKYISEHMDVLPPTIFETAVAAGSPSSPNLRKNVLVGVLAGLVLSAGIVVLRELLDDTIKDEEDVEKYLGLPVLASVPDRKDYINTKNRREGDSRSHLKEKTKSASSRSGKTSGDAAVRKTRTTAERNRAAAAHSGPNKVAKNKPQTNQVANDVPGGENKVEKESVNNGAND